MKAHVAVDSRYKLIHTVLVSAATVADCLALPHLLHGKETCVWGDQAIRPTRAERDPALGRFAGARLHQSVRYRWGKRTDEQIKAKNRNKSRIRSKVEHSIGVIKRIFGFQKVRYRGLAKNLHRLEVTAALAKLFVTRRSLLCGA